MQEKAAHELDRVQLHCLGPVLVRVIFPLKSNLAIFQRQQTTVGDGHSMGVPRQIFQHLFGSAERRLGVDDPFDFAVVVAQSFEGVRLGQWCEFSVELELTLAEGVPQVDQKCVAEPRAENCYREEERSPASDPTRAVRCDTATGHYAVNMRVEMEVCPQVCSTARKPTAAPRRLGSAAIVSKVSESARNRME